MFNKFSYKLDIFALGITMLETMSLVDAKNFYIFVNNQVVSINEKIIQKTMADQLNEYI